MLWQSQLLQASTGRHCHYIFANMLRFKHFVSFVEDEEMRKCMRSTMTWEFEETVEATQAKASLASEAV